MADILSRGDFEKKKFGKIKNPRRSFNPHGYANNNVMYINARLKNSKIF